MVSDQASTKTQCPHCFTIYQITASQLERSKGNVRCGNCHDRFKAVLLNDSELQEARAKAKQHKSELENDLFTHQGNDGSDQTQTGESVRSDSELISEELVSNKSRPNEIRPDSPPLQKATSAFSIKNVESEITRQKQDLKPELELERRESNTPRQSATSSSSPNSRRNAVFDFQIDDSEFSLPHDGESPTGKVRQDPPLEEGEVDLLFGNLNALTEQENDHLIDEIDRIIDHRLVAPRARGDSNKSRDTNTAYKADNATSEPTVTPKVKPAPVRSIDWHEETALDISTIDESPDGPLLWEDEDDDDLFLEPTNRGDRQGGGTLGLLWKLFGLSVLLILLLTFVYQLWLKQFDFISTNEVIQGRLNSAFLPVLDHLKDIGIEAPRPSSLDGIALISAQSEPHPNQASTTLLRVSFINRSSEQQALPWLELTLTDENAKIVARRALQPEDYLFNNDTASLIGPHELKKITIELLAFPDAATGFELKMLQAISGPL